MTTQIEKLRDEIQELHVEAATHKQAYEITQDRIVAKQEEIGRLLLAEQREALSHANCTECNGQSASDSVSSIHP